MMPFGIADVILLVNGEKFVSKRIKSIFAYLEVKHLTRTAFLLQTNGQVESHNKTLVSILGMYLSTD